MNIIKLKCVHCNHTYAVYSNESKSCSHCDGYDFVYFDMRKIDKTI